MASKVSGVIEKIKVGGTERAIASSAYGYCETAATEQAKVVDMTDFELYEGVTIHVKFKEKNNVASPTLNVQGTGAKPIVQYGTTAAGKTSETNGWYAGAVLTLTYDGTSWVRDQGFNTNSTYNYMRPYGSTASATAAKVGTAGWKFQLAAGKYFMFTQYYDNTAQSALTLNIGSTGAKPIYINGEPSSSTNYTLPGGQYLVYYDGTNYYFRTDDKMSGNIAGNADTATTTTNLANNPSIQASTSNTNQVTITAGGKTSDAYTIPYATAAGTANNATSLTNFVVTTYTIASSKGVRITYSSKVPVLISAQQSHTGGCLILLGGGYGSGATTRNAFTEVVSSNTTMFTWSLPESIGNSIEIMNNSANAIGNVTIWSKDACTCEEITALTNPATNRILLHTQNYSSYALPLSGGEMTGQIKTSFQSSIAIGSYCSSQNTIANLIEEVRYSSGCMGSVQITTAYTLTNITVPTGWYNFIYVPHRSGGVNGAASGDNCNYGILYLHRMDNPAYGDFKISLNNSSISLARMDASFSSAPTAGNVVIAAGTQGAIQTSGYTIAASVPSGAVFTDTYVSQSSTATDSWCKILLHHTYDGTSNADVTSETNVVYAAKGVSVQPQSGTIRANAYNVADNVKLQWNSTDLSLDFIFL